MKISYNWLKQFVDMPYSPEELSGVLTSCGLEVEHLAKWQSVAGGLQGLVIGKVVTCNPHSNADRLRITTVDTGDGQIRQIVCGAPNVAAGQTVIVALPGTKLYPSSGEAFEIKKSKIRGETSEGMICAEDEIGLGSSHDGIMILPDSIPAGTPASDYFRVENDWIFEIGLTPNRADAASHLGVARDILAILSMERSTALSMPDLSAFSEGTETNRIRAEVLNKEACIRYSGLEIRGVHVGASPEWMQNRLKSIGLRPVNAIVDVTNYVMHELGQPLHAFDADKIGGNIVKVGQLPAGTRFRTLDDTERTLQGTELMICDENGGLCMAGVFGGIRSGVTGETTAVFIESACFHPVHVRKSAKLHALHTDSSFRFERGTDPEMTVVALKRAALLIQELAGGNIYGKITDIYPVAVQPYSISLSLDYLDTLVGNKINPALVKKILVNLGISVTAEQNGIMSLSVPSFKVDVTRPADIVEEVLRIYGYNRVELPKKISITPAGPAKPDPEETLERAGSFLVANGFCEIVTNSLTRVSHLEVLPVQGPAEEVRVLNPLSNDLALMRHHMLLTGLESIAYNINRRRKDLRFFEHGKTYCKLDDKYIERKHLCFWLSGSPFAEHWKSKQGDYDIYFVKALLEQLFVNAGVEVRKTFSLREGEVEGLDNALSFNFGKETVAVAGKVKKTILKAMDIAQPVWYADISFDVWLRMLNTRDKEVSGPPKFPEVRRDLSMLLSREVRYAELENMAYSAEPELLKDVNLFDVYEGDKIEAGKKSYALSFTLRDEESTLQEKQIESVMNKLMKLFETKLGAVIRKS